MYGLGVFEILIIFIVLLLFFRPVEIFGLFRRFGVWYNKIRRMENDLRKEWEIDTASGDKAFGFDADESDKEGENL